MADYRSIIAWAVSYLPSTADEARRAIYEQARAALHERLGSDPQISGAELVNEHHRLEVAIYDPVDDILLFRDKQLSQCAKHEGAALFDVDQRRRLRSCGWNCGPRLAA